MAKQTVKDPSQSRWEARDHRSSWGDRLGARLPEFNLSALLRPSCVTLNKFLIPSKPPFHS